jgi:hypothetical protein
MLAGDAIGFHDDAILVRLVQHFLAPTHRAINGQANQVQVKKVIGGDISGVTFPLPLLKGFGQKVAIHARHAVNGLALQRPPHPFAG